MEHKSPKNTSYEFFNNVFSHDINVYKILSRIQLFFKSFLLFVSTILKTPTIPHNIERQPCSSSSRISNNNNFNKNEKICIGKEEICMVMDRLGIACDDIVDGDYITTTTTTTTTTFEGVNDHCMSSLLDDDDDNEEENDVGLEDIIKGAFDVFDDNKDGFVDERELQRVLLALGLHQGNILEECKRMISVFDENGDGLIDFKEFITLTNYIFSC